jgi:hypothetical protein
VFVGLSTTTLSPYRSASTYEEGRTKQTRICKTPTTCGGPEYRKYTACPFG